MRKARRQSPEGLLKHNLDMCSRHGDLLEALRLYDEARRDGVNLALHHYNVLLYLCSLDGERGSNLQRGFEIFQSMVMDKVVPNEATFTSAARIAAAKEDPDMAFDLIKQMKGFGIVPKLRSYGPALFGLRAAVRQVSETTAGIIEGWFKCETAAKVREENWDVRKVKEGVVRGGGGWHGQGWLGSGEWRVVRTHMDGAGICQSCGEKLVSIDIDPKETENFATSLTNLACQKELRPILFGFSCLIICIFVNALIRTVGRFSAGNERFRVSKFCDILIDLEGELIQEWLQKYGPFDAVVDGANVGLVSMHTFSFYQLNSVVKQLRQMSPSKRLPLIILHKNRVTGGPAQHPNNKKLLEHWKNSGALYATPPGSNDDW
ncbi:proteinaceous RNase P 1, chloroplastic/mitochondrial-like isoform X3 [Fagus crenata]